MSRKKGGRSPVRWFVYMLECERDCLYTGIAVDVEARFAQHIRGKGAAYTRANPPRRILAEKRCASRSAALKLEYALKQLAPPEKREWADRNRFKRGRMHRAASGHEVKGPARK